MNASFWISEDDNGELRQHVASQADVDLMDNLAANQAKRTIIRQRAEEFTARSIFEFVMDGEAS